MFKEGDRGDSGSHRTVGTDWKHLESFYHHTAGKPCIVSQQPAIGPCHFEWPLNFLLTRVKMYLFIYLFIASNHWQKCVELLWMKAAISKFLAKKLWKKKSNTLLCVFSIVNILILYNTSVYFIFFLFTIYIRPHDNLTSVRLCDYWRKQADDERNKRLDNAERGKNNRSRKMSPAYKGLYQSRSPLHNKQMWTSR